MTDKKSKWIKNIILAVLMAAVGITVSVQFRMVRAQKESAAQEESRKLADYEKQLEQLELELQKLREEYQINDAAYTYRLSQLAESDSSFYSTVKTYHDSINSLKNNAGLADVKGEGITVTVSDAVNASSDVYNSTLLVHDTTLMQLVNDLKLAGASAISVNGERIVALSEFLCVGPAVRVNGTKLFAPFLIRAVGDPAKLEAAVRNSSIFSSGGAGIKWEIAQEKELVVGAYNKAYRNNIGLLQECE